MDTEPRNENQKASDNSAKTTVRSIEPFETRRARLHEKAMELPLTPGVYMMHDRSGKIVYIGKSKALRNRVSRYFALTTDHPVKTDHMVHSVYDFDYILTDTEIEALALENRLIKLHMPKYNIRLKDCKSYPYIKVSVSDDYPRITVTRKRDADKAKYFGPYSGMDAAYSILKTLQTSFGIPSCKLVFPRDIGKERPCIYSQMGRCIAPCRGDITNAEYRDAIKDVLTFLGGSFADVRRSLEEKMQTAAENLMFESAAIYRDRLKYLQKLWDKQKVVGSEDAEADLFGLYHGEICSCLTVFYMREGCIVDSQNFIFAPDQIVDSENIASVISELYTGREYIPRDICLGFELDSDEITTLGLYLSECAGRKVNVKIPERGNFRQLCALVNENSRVAAKNADAENERDSKILVRLAELLSLEVIPQKIEAYDISNFGSDNIVAGMIASIDCKFKKSAYRLYNIKSTDGQNDYAAMREAVGRRLKHTDGADEALPDLILLDGGKGHVSVIRSLIEEEGYNIPVFGMVKDEYHKTRALSSDTSDIGIAREQSVFTFIYKLQEEVHRYTVSHMSAAKSKTLKKSSLEKIKGIGPEKASALLLHFGTLKKLKEATEEEIAAVKGISKANASDISEYFDSKDKGKEQK